MRSNRFWGPIFTSWKPLVFLCAGLSACSEQPVATAAVSVAPSAVAKAASDSSAITAPAPSTDVSSEPITAEGYAARDDVAAFIQEMVKKHAFTPVELNRVFAQVETKASILKAMSRPAEKVKPWYDYRNIFIQQKRIDDGVAFWTTHQSALDAAEKRYGVPADVIVAIIGVETFYGRITGSYRVIDALSTLAFDYPKRAAFFRKELEQYLLLAQEQQQPLLALKGSYAGAMGYGQFMPSSYRAYAQDFDRDGFADVWNNPTDAIGSVANYFKQFGWASGEGVVVPARVTGSLRSDLLNDDFKPKRRLSELQRGGIVPASDAVLPNGLTDTTNVRAIELEGKTGSEYWITLPNFYVITRYNHSSMYAMAVHQLSQALKAAKLAQASVL